MRIAVASDLFRPSRGGTETTTDNLARGLASLDNKVLVIAPGPSFWKSFASMEDGQQVFRVRSIPVPIVPNLRLSRAPYGVIKRQLDVFKPDVIHVNNHFALGKALIRYGRARHIPVVVGCHFMPESFLYGLRQYNVRLYDWLRMVWWRRIVRIYNQAAAVIGPTQTAINYLAVAGLRIPGKAISNGVDIEANRPSDTSQSDMRRQLGLPERPTIIYVGRLSAEKQISLIIRAVQLALRRQEMQLVLVGSGLAQPSLTALAAKLGIADSVIFTGYLAKPSDKSRYLAAAELFVIASTVELQSIVTLEAMACGKPVVAVSEGALSELVQVGVNGELFPPDDPQALSEVLVRLLAHPELVKRYGEASRKLVAAHDIRQFAQHYYDFYRTLMN